VKKILVLCPYPVGVAPSQRLKYEQYFDRLKKAGFELVPSPFMSLSLWKVVYHRGHLPEKIFWTTLGYFKRILDLFRIPFYDGIYVSLHSVPFGGPTFEKIVYLLARKSIYDIDDLVFLGKSSPVNRLEKLKDPEKIYFQMARADHVITCTPYLTEIALKRNRRVTDISSTVDTDRYQPKKHHSDPIVTLGWSGSLSTSPYLKLLVPVLKEVQKERKCRILVIGDANFSIAGIEVEALPWMGETEVADLSRIDIGLYPLPEEEWVLGKSGLKAIQYMAMGIPPVATAIGANYRVIEDGVNGFLAKNEQEWKTAILKLIDNPQLRAEMGKKSRAKAEALFSLNANTPIYEKVFKETFGSN